MLEQFVMYKNLIIGGVILVMVMSVWFYVSGLEDEVVGLKSELKDMYIELANEKLQSSRYKSSLDTQNLQIDMLKANEVLALSKLSKWKNQKPEIKYKTITKIREVKSDECKDIKDSIDSIRNINYDSL